MIDGFFQILENGVRCGRQTLHQPLHKKKCETEKHQIRKERNITTVLNHQSQHQPAEDRSELSTKNSQQPRKKENRTLHYWK